MYKKLENNKAVNAKGVSVILSGYITFLSTKYMNLLYPKLLIFFNVKYAIKMLKSAVITVYFVP